MPGILAGSRRHIRLAGEIGDRYLQRPRERQQLAHIVQAAAPLLEGPDRTDAVTGFQRQPILSPPPPLPGTRQPQAVVLADDSQPHPRQSGSTRWPAHPMYPASQQP